MANEQNLIPFDQRSESEARENGRKGGIKSGESRRKTADIRKRLREALNNTYTDKQTGAEIEGTEGIILALMGKALNRKDRDNLNAIKYILYILGEDKPETDLKRQEAETKLIQAKVDMLTGADTTALEKLDELLRETRENANTESKTE